MVTPKSLVVRNIQVVNGRESRILVYGNEIGPSANFRLVPSAYNPKSQPLPAQEASRKSRIEFIRYSFALPTNSASSQCYKDTSSPKSSTSTHE